MAATGKTSSSIWETVKTVFWALVIAGLFRTLFFQPFWIPSGSMKDTLLIGDFLFVNKMAYGYSYASCPSIRVGGLNIDAQKICAFIDGDNTRIFGSEPERGDIIVFRQPTDGTDFIKRDQFRDDGGAQCRGKADRNADQPHINQDHPWRGCQGKNGYANHHRDQMPGKQAAGRMFVNQRTTAKRAKDGGDGKNREPGSKPPQFNFLVGGNRPLMEKQGGHDQGRCGQHRHAEPDIQRFEQTRMIT